MIEQARHLPLLSRPWDPKEAANAIDEIVADALGHFDRERFWPAHARDDGLKDGHSSIYFGAAGVIWGLEHLSRVGATMVEFDFRPYLPRLLDTTKAEMATYKDYASNGSLLFGDLGTALLIMRLEPSSTLADLIQMRANANSELPIRELMWGLPGSMLACLSMAEMTGEARWRAIFETQAERLLADLQDTADGAALGTRPISQAAKISRACSRICGEHGPAHARMELANGEPADAHCRSSAAHLEQERLADRCRHLMAWHGRSRQAAVALSALPRRTGHGHDICRCTVHVA